MTSDYHLASLSEDDRIEFEAAAQQAEEWAAFEQDMATEYPWPESIDEPRKAA